MTRGAISLAAMFALAACGNDEHITDGPIAIDSPMTDGPPTIDAGPADARIDAMPMIDAVPSTVLVVAGGCPGMPDHLLTQVGGVFMFDGAGGNPPIMIGVGENIEFVSELGHNFANITGPTGQFGFRSGSTTIQHTVCLTYTAALAGTYVCEAHPLTMTNAITVN